jgi:FkbM family methyltransferase
VIDADLVYDVGLHDGVDTAFYLSRGYRVIAVDANPEAVRSAEQVFRQAIADERLTLVHGAIADGESETVTLYLSDQREWSSLIPEIAGRDGVGVREVVVPTTSIAELLAQHGTPVYLKIDIEGMDEVALQDLATTSARPTYLSVEAESADDSGRSDRDALAKLDLLVGMGYQRFKLVDQDTLRVLAMDDLELGPRKNFGTRLRARLGKRRRERSAVLRVGGRRTRFPLGATGPFGPDLAGDWLEEDEARTLLTAARRAYFRRDDARVYGFWCDWHATSPAASS